MLDLFTPVVPQDQWHENFRIIQNQWSRYDLDVFQEWAKGFKDRDGKFVKQFQTTFNACFWELYLFACMKHLELKVDFSYSAPDFVVTNFLTKFSIEATIASNADGLSEEWQRQDRQSIDRDAIVDEATVRLANALTAKHRKFLSSYSQMSHVVDKPFVLAIAPFEQPYFEVQNDQAMTRVLYAYDKPVRGSSGQIYHEYMRSILKKNGSEIELGFFLDGRMKEISAVLFSNTATAGKVRALSRDPSPAIIFNTLRFNKAGQEPFMLKVIKPDHFETLLDGLHVFHNPYAVHKLPWDLFAEHGVTQHKYDPNHPWPPFMANHGALIQRSVITYKPK